MLQVKHTILTSYDIQELLKVKGFFGRWLAQCMMRVFKLNKLNKMYDDNYDEDSIKFTENCLNHLNNQVLVADSDLANIPETGPVIILFNHPYGLLDALIVMKVLLKKRPDTKFIANFLLSRVEPARIHLLEVNPFEERKKAFSSASGLKAMYKIIENGGVVCIMPAGEVSTKYGKSKVVEDRDWQSNIIKFIKSSDAPVVSGFISGSNTRLFHLMGRIHPALRTARIPAELLNKRNLKISVRLSGPFQPKLLKSIEDRKILASVLKAKTYCLDNSQDNCEHETKFHNYKKIIDQVPIEALKNEIEKIREKDLLFVTDNYHVFFSTHNDIPFIYKELSRLRELTFREVGEGTGNECDTDKFDLYYHHLFIWDDSASAIVGAYRIGMGADVLHEKGVDGFYINTLFKFNPGFNSYLEHSMEMGRSFIVPDYQRKPLPLFLLWKGIYFVTQKYPKYKYLIGPVSISSLYSINSKILLIEYLKRYHNWPQLTGLVEDRIEFRYSVNHHHETLLNNFGENILGMDRLIKEIDINHFGIPILIKKYLSLGGKIINFNIDPDFNFAIDGFVVLDISVVAEEVIKSYNK